MKSQKTLPEGYNVKLKIDLLNDKKPMITVNIISAVLLILTAAAGCIFDPFNIDFSKLLISVALIFIYMLLHELVHGIFMYSFSGVKPTYGYKVLYAYAGSTAYFSKVHYIIIALAPIIFWGIVLLVIGLFTRGTSWFWVFYIVQCINISGAAGDLYVSFIFKDLPKDILVNDTGIAMTVYSKE